MLDEDLESHPAYQFHDAGWPLDSALSPVGQPLDYTYTSYQSFNGSPEPYVDHTHPGNTHPIENLGHGLGVSLPSAGSSITGRSPHSESSTSLPAQTSSLAPPNLHFLLPQMASLPPSPPLALNPDDLSWDRAGKGGKLRVRCPRCNKWIATGSNQHNTGPLANHMQSGSKCRAQSVFDEEFARTRAARNALFPLSTNGPSALQISRSHSAPPFSHDQDSVQVQFDVTTPSKFRHKQYTTLNDDSSDIEIDSPPPSPRPASNITEQLTWQPTLPTVVISEHMDSQHPIEPLASTSNSSTEPAAACPGIYLDWPTGDFWNQYPFHRHDYSLASLGYKFCAVEKDGTQFRVRADMCARIPMPDGSACPDCKAITKTVERLVSMARRAESHTNHKYLNHQQLRNLLADRDETVKFWKLKAMNLGRKCASVFRKLDDCKRFVMAVATGDIPRLQQLVRQGLKEGAGIAAIISKIEQALDDTYHARGYTLKDFDIALMVFRLGGRKLLYALSQYISVPSIRTLRRAHAFTQLMPSIGSPKLDEILFNIRSIFIPKINDLDQVRPFRSGMSIFWDEVNEEDVACYFPHLDCVGGLCREHSSHINTRLATFDNAVTIARALADGTVHYGKEASVIALGSFGKILRGAFPVLVSPTCKQESPVESATVLQLVISAWKDLGEKHFGPIWSFASDGDAGRRAMVYQLFMKRPIDAAHVLFKYLSGLPGLNLFVGEGDITADFDWKHEVKRIARLMRTNEGLVVGRTIVNFETLRHHLLRDNSLSADAVDILMNPADSQDVPRAIDFIQAVSSVGTIPVNPDDLNPTELQEIQVIRVIGEMFTAFLHPFIRPDWTLTEQVSSLSKYAHISFILFRDFRVNFMPYQLYGDLQTTIKNIIFCIAKQQEMDGSQPFYIFWTGDDRLEVLFGRTRMQGGHNPNFSFKQLLDRLAAAMDLDGVFLRNPELDQGHRRLKVTRTEKADHLNPESWIGNVIANQVDLAAAWLNGRKLAIDTLQGIGIRPDFDALFDHNRTLDMLKPFGDGKYPGVSSEPDRSLEPDVSTASPVPTEPSTLVFYSAEQDDIPAITDDTLEGPTAPVVITPLSTGEASIVTVPVGAELADDELTLEEHLDEVRDLPSPSNIEHPSPWIEHEGKKIHKSSICRLVITPDYIRKSHERPLRVRNYTSDLKPRNYNSDNIIDSDAFIVGDLFSTLICCDNTVSLAVLKSIAIEEKGVRVDRVKGQSLPHSAAGIKITGQILDMRMVPSAPPSSSSETSTSDHAASVTTAYSWIWNGSFIKLDLDQANPSPVSKAARKTIAVILSSVVCEPINAQVAKADSRLTFDDCPELNSTGLTWELSDGELVIVCTKLWETVKEANTLGLLPRFRTNSGFPYRDSLRANMALICEDGSRVLEARRTGSKDKFRCYQCLLEIDPGKARTHVGQHILKAIRGVPENNAGEPVGSRMPCGFCGRSGISSCGEVYLTKGSHPQAQTNCRHAHKFHYAPSLKSTNPTPSTNVPILCEIPGCKGQVGQKWTAVWKYNMPEHIRSEHEGYSLDNLEDGAPLPGTLTTSMFITREEEERLGIPREKIPPKPSLPSGAAPSQSTKRARAGSFGANPAAAKRNRKK